MAKKVAAKEDSATMMQANAAIGAGETGKSATADPGPMPMTLSQAYEHLKSVANHWRALAALDAALAPAATLEGQVNALHERYRQLVTETGGLEKRLEELKQEAWNAEEERRKRLEEVDGVLAARTDEIEDLVRAKGAEVEQRLKTLQDELEQAEADHQARLDALVATRAEAEAKTREAQEALETLRAKIGG